MKKWNDGIVVASFLMLFLFGYFMIVKSPITESYIANPPSFNTTKPLEWISAGAPPALPNPDINPRVFPADVVVADLFDQRKLSREEQSSLQTWNRFDYLVSNGSVLPNALEAIKEAGVAWKNLIASVEDEKLQQNASSGKRGKEKQCPHYLSNMNASTLDTNGFKLRVPCGLTQGSSITLIGIPNGLLGNFRIDLTGEPLPGEPDPPLILHYNVRLHGNNVTEDPVIVQNTWTRSRGWGEEERCPSPDKENNEKVDELDQCNELVGKENNHTSKPNQLANVSTNASMLQDGKLRKYFPFKQNDLFVATLRVNSEGIQMTVDGKHITSFALRETLEPWLTSEVRISGDINLISVVVNGLPTSEELEPIVDLESLKAIPLPSKKQLHLFIGVFSTANNFKRRMAVRRSWMQYPTVRSGEVAVRFFVGLHKNQMVNEELWNEARTYGDIQLMFFVDYYNLITWKAIAICIFGTDIVSAKYIMKTDDDSFVRVDEMMNSLDRTNVTQGLLYGHINSESQPDRNPYGKWYISPEEWPGDRYPPWANGPGYVVTHDIAKAISKKHRKGRLKMFKLEDVAMGIWIQSLNGTGVVVRYEKDDRVITEGCKDGYIVAHYQSPRDLLCLWQKLQDKKRAECCGYIPVKKHLAAEPKAEPKFCGESGSNT